MPNTHSTLTSLFSDIANAIRAKKGTSADIVADNFPSEIASIPSGGITPTGNINITDTSETDVAAFATAQISSDTLLAENIKKNVNILGIIGSFEGGGGIQTGTFTPLAQTSSIPITVDSSISSKPFVVIVALDNHDVTLINNGVVLAIWRIIDPSNNMSNIPILAVRSNPSIIDGSKSQANTTSSWNSTAKELSLVARGSSNWYESEQYHFAIVPLDGFNLI